MATFVLVTGQHCGAWSWKKVIPLLRAAGHDVYATTATGLGDRVHLASASIDLDTHITDVVNVLEFEGLTEVTLVGWSYGGMIITGVAERVPERLAQLVYLDALVPMHGQNLYDTVGASEEDLARDRAAAEAAGLPGFFPVPSGEFADLIRSWIPDPTDQAWFFCEGDATPDRDPHPADTAGESGGRGGSAGVHPLHRRQRPNRPHSANGGSAPVGARLAIPGAG